MICFWRPAVDTFICSQSPRRSKFLWRLRHGRDCPRRRLSHWCLSQSLLLRSRQWSCTVVAWTRGQALETDAKCTNAAQSQLRRHWLAACCPPVPLPAAAAGSVLMVALAHHRLVSSRYYARINNLREGELPSPVRGPSHSLPLPPLPSQPANRITRRMITTWISAITCHAFPSRVFVVSASGV